jgi:hypothetical protein
LAIALLAFCCSSSSFSGLGGLLFKSALDSISGENGSELGKDSTKKKVKVTSPSPPTTKWYETNGDDPSVTHVGVVLARYTKDQVPDIAGRDRDPGWVSPFLANACHADSRCTGFQVDSTKGVAWLKDHDSVPSECLNTTKKCSDSDWKKEQGRYTYFHPERGWKQQSDKVLRVMKELDCSSGSNCKLQEILGAISWALTGLSLVPFTWGVTKVLGGSSMATRIAMTSVLALEKAIDVAENAFDVVTLKMSINAAKKEGSFPLDNRPLIGIDDYYIGKDPDMYERVVQSAATTSVCYKPGSLTPERLNSSNPEDRFVGPHSQCTQAEKQQIHELLNERRARVYDPWLKQLADWEKLPESESNEGGFEWEQAYKNTNNLALNVVQRTQEGKIALVLPSEAERVAKRELEWKNTAYLQASAQSGNTRSSTRATTAPKSSNQKTSAPKMTPVPSSTAKKSTPTPTKKW